MDPRTGKSKVIIDTSARLYERGLIKGVLIIAWPSGVHHNWIANEFPAHLPDRIPWYGHTWFTTHANQKSKRAGGRIQVGQVKYNQSFEKLLTFDGLKVFAVNAEALRLGKKGESLRKAIGAFIKSCGGRVLCAGDESIFFQTPGKPRARIMQNIGRIVPYRRVLDGTPISNQGPLGLYTQLKFLSPSILGFADFNSCRAYYAEVEEQGDRLYHMSYHVGLQIAADKGIAEVGVNSFAHGYAIKQGGRAWTTTKKDEAGTTIYRNIEEFRARIASCSYRATFRDCFKDVPSPCYHAQVFELTKEQRRVYDELATEFRSQLQSGIEIEAAMVLVRYLRLQQITSNYWPSSLTGRKCETCGGEGCNDCDGLGVIVRETGLEHIDAKYNPRLSHMWDMIEGGDPWIIWARFDQEIDEIMSGAETLGYAAVRYDGAVTSMNKIKARDDFQSGRAQLFVAKQQSAGRGIPLWRARGHMIVSNTFSLGTRLQLEMRTEIAHRRVPTEIHDFIAHNTIDDNVIVPSLRANRDIADVVMGDPRKAWI